MDRLYSEHAQLRAELALNQSTGASSNLANQYSYGGIGRPPTSMSRRTHLSAITSGTRTSAANTTMTRAISEPLTVMRIPSTVEEEESAQLDHKAAKKPSRPPVLLSGAFTPRKVVPSAPDSYITAHPDRHTPTFAGTQDPFSSSDDNDSSDSDEANSRRRTVPTISVPPYGYVPGVGYVPMAPSPPLMEGPDDAAGQLVLYNPEQTYTRDRMPFVEGAEIRGHPSQPEEIIPVTPWGSLGNDRARNANSSSTSVATLSITGPSNYAPRLSTSSSLSSLNLLTNTPSAPQPHAHTSPRRETNSPEPSVASWGTVPSARTSIGTSIRDLQLTGLPAPVADLDLFSQPSPLRSSFGDLRLTGLPNASTRNSSLLEVARSDDGGDVVPTRGVTWEENVIPPRPEEGTYSLSASHRRRREADASREPEDLDEILTPRVRRTSAEPISLGLSLSSSSSSSRLHPTGTPDLNAVNHSLARTHSDSRATPRHRHFRIASVPDVAGSPRTGSRPGVSHAGDTDSVEIAVRPTSHRHNGSHSRRDGSSTSTSRRNSLMAPYTDRISGPLQLPSAVQRSESHGDYNRQRRHSTLTFPHLSASQLEDEISDRHGRVTRDSVLNGVDHAHVAPRTQHENSRPASIYSMSGPLFSGPSSDSLASTGSLGLSLAPPAGPGSSAATTSSGEPSTIRAPRPVNGSHPSNFFAAWGRRSAR
ncbi:hypothetical protein BDY19DRAFT_307263 [Irpex rosettiformis]|uniref:Uncharacterized protein n=1 Tax=Irpex rosettiformis TaxID=378272 RepID=A0ACB8TYX1_9APHY|nr:hypothetical protein BDY19DRAFT_307263 [Irpex rosettiformis]